MKLPILKDAKLFGKRVFLRADVDIPLAQQSTNNSQQTTIGDDTRLVAALLTIEYLLEHGAKVIVAGHLGRPDIKNQESGIRNQEFSLKPVAECLLKKIKNQSPIQSGTKIKNTKIEGFDGWKLTPKLFLLENLRFYDGEENPTTDSGLEFSRKLASLADVYVNDAFAVCHRAHASIVSVPKYLPHFAGLRLQKEVEVLSEILENPKRPLVVVVGGAKIETKLPLVEKMHGFADYVLVGGKIAGETQALLKVQREKLKGRRPALLVADLNQEGTDITSKSVENFLQIIGLAKTVVWNGPVGKTQNPELRTKNFEDTEKGARELAKGIVKSKAYSIVGGGDTVEFLNRIKLIDKFSFASTGGGAMLSFLSGEKLPGLVALTKT